MDSSSSLVAPQHVKSEAAPVGPSSRAESQAKIYLPSRNSIN
jgi:hypothetical protein